jgi:hypothetical protein
MPSRCRFPRHATQPRMTYLGAWKCSPLQAGNSQPKTERHAPILLIPEWDKSVLLVYLVVKTLSGCQCPSSRMLKCCLDSHGPSCRDSSTSVYGFARNLVPFYPKIFRVHRAGFMETVPVAKCCQHHHLGTPPTQASNDTAHVSYSRPLVR